MPLFKFNLHAAVMPSLEVDGVAVQSTPYSEADVEFPLILVSGAMATGCEAMMPILTVSGRMEGIAEGDAILPLLVVDGEAVVPAQIEGAASFPLITVSGSMQTEANIEMPCLRVFGDVLVGNRTDGHVSLPLLVVGGDAAEIPRMVGSATFPTLLVNGSASQSVSMTAVGNVIFPHFNASATIAGQGHHGQGLDSVLRYADNRRLI